MERLGSAPSIHPQQVLKETRVILDCKAQKGIWVYRVQKVMQELLVPKEILVCRVQKATQELPDPKEILEIRDCKVSPGLREIKAIPVMVLMLGH